MRKQTSRQQLFFDSNPMWLRWRALLGNWTKRLLQFFLTNGLLFHVSSEAVFTLVILPDARTVRERYTSGCPCTHCGHCVGFVGTLRPHREVFSVDANGTRRVGDALWMLEWTHRVQQRRAVCACLQTNLFLSTPLICNAANRARRNHDTVG